MTRLHQLQLSLTKFATTFQIVSMKYVANENLNECHEKNAVASKIDYYLKTVRIDCSLTFSGQLMGNSTQICQYLSKYIV